MRIIQLLPHLGIGGMERLAIDLAKQQKRDGHKPSIFCTSGGGPLETEAEAAGIPLRTFGKNTGFSPRLIRQLASALREDRAEVLHAHNAVVLHYGIAAARLARVPVIINTRHGGNLRWDPRLEWVWSRMVPWTDGLVFVSEGVRDYFIRRNGISRRNTHVIYNGVDLVKFSGRRALPGAKEGTFRFGTVGRLWPAKDHVTLVRAFAALAGELPGSELHIMGDGPCRQVIAESAASLGISARVFLHGAGLDVAGFLATLDLFVLSSVDEGLPIALMEAMLAGLPIVSTQLPGLTELAPENAVAWYCPAAQPEKMAALMLQMARRTDLALIGDRAHSLGLKFGIDASCRQYNTLFEEILRKKHRRQSFRLAFPHEAS